MASESFLRISLFSHFFNLLFMCNESTEIETLSYCGATFYRADFFFRFELFLFNWICSLSTSTTWFWRVRNNETTTGRSDLLRKGKWWTSEVKCLFFTPTFGLREINFLCILLWQRNYSFITNNRSGIPGSSLSNEI